MMASQASRSVVRRFDRGLAWPAPWTRAPGATKLARSPVVPVSAPADDWPRAGSHPLADASASTALQRRATQINAAFDAIEPLLQRLALRQFDAGSAQLARRELQATCGLDLSEAELAARWNAPLDMRRLHARCVLHTFAQLLARPFDRSHAALDEGEDAATLIRRWGLHAIDVSACADGRLAGLLDFVLRVPPAIVACRKSHAGALFDVGESLRHWEAVELRRWRESHPNPAAEPTRFLKLGVYHFSSVDPRHEGCAAHGSDERRAAQAVLERLQQFSEAVQRVHCCGASVATLLVGVDTDTDAIRVHVPDGQGRMTIDRHVCALATYRATAGMSRAGAKEAIRRATADCAGVAVDDAATEGMRWFCGYLLKNNIAQIDAVRAAHGGPYPDRGHTERLIVVGDALDGVQLRNLVFQAQMESIEERSGDLDVGLRILGAAHAERAVALPVLVHRSFDARIPGARERAVAHAQRMLRAVGERHAPAIGAGAVSVEAAVSDPAAPRLQFVAPEQAAARGCGCSQAEHP